MQWRCDGWGWPEGWRNHDGYTLDARPAASLSCLVIAERCDRYESPLPKYACRALLFPMSSPPMWQLVVIKFLTTPCNV